MSSRLVGVPNPNDHRARAFWRALIDANTTPRGQTIPFTANPDFALAPDFDSVVECTSPPPGMVGWWAGDNNALDIRGDNHGSLQNGATFATGKVAQAFSLDGVDDYVDVQGSSAISAINSITVEAWICWP